jgi:hypothetical protein
MTIRADQWPVIHKPVTKPQHHSALYAKLLREAGRGLISNGKELETARTEDQDKS